MTDWIIRGRQAGKTTDLVRTLLAIPDSVLIVPNQQRREEIREIVRRLVHEEADRLEARVGREVRVLKADIEQPMYRVFAATHLRELHEVARNYPGPRLIDNLEESLERLLGFTVAQVSVNTKRDVLLSEAEIEMYGGLDERPVSIR